MLGKTEYVFLNICFALFPLFYFISRTEKGSLIFRVLNSFSLTKLELAHIEYRCALMDVCTHTYTPPKDTSTRCCLR